MSRNGIANRLSSLYDRRALREYARWKVRWDPAYAAVLQHLRGRHSSLLDLGCGVGLLAFYLREHGFTAPVIGVDFDERKVHAARKAAQRYRGIDFVTGDVQDPLPENHDVVMLDVLQYLDDRAQQQTLANIARAVPPGGIAVLRQGIRDRSFRYRLTLGVEILGRRSGWLKADDLNYPTRQSILAPFESFELEERPLWGRTPYNNYLFVFRRSA